MSVPAKVVERMKTNLTRLKPVLHQQRQRDVSEADTVTLIKDLLSDVFGFDKYSELTGELAIRGTYCDLAIKIGDKLQMLIEAKAIGIGLEDRHVKQAVDYAANQGCDWVVLTNGIVWRLYNVVFAKPIDKILIMEINLCEMEPGKRAADAELLYVMTREGITKGAHTALRDRQVGTSRYMMAAIITSNPTTLDSIRTALKKTVSINVTNEEIANILINQVVKRDALEGLQAEQARELIARNKTPDKQKPRAKPDQSKPEQPPLQQPPAEASGQIAEVIQLEQAG